MALLLPRSRAVALLLEGEVHENMCHGTTTDGVPWHMFQHTAPPSCSATARERWSTPRHRSAGRRHSTGALVDATAQERRSTPQHGSAGRGHGTGAPVEFSRQESWSGAVREKASAA